MSNADFFKQFQAIEYNIERKAKAEVQEINQQKMKKIKEINSEFIQNLIRDLREKTEIFLKNYENQLNQQISENIKDLNLKILKKKNEIFDDYKKSLIVEIQAYIANNYEAYFQNIIKKIKTSLKIFDNTVYIRLNDKDMESFKKLQSEFENKKLFLDPKKLDCIGGYTLSNKASTITIMDTIEDSIETHLKILRMNFAKIFPEYRDRRKSATELMKERNISISASFPEELEEYMLKYDIELPEK